MDLFLLNHNGIFMDYIPKEVKVLCLPESYHLFSLPFYQSIKKLLLKGKISLLFNRIMFALINKNNKNISQKEQYGWKYISESLEKIDKNMM